MKTLEEEQNEADRLWYEEVYLAGAPDWMRKRARVEYQVGDRVTAPMGTGHVRFIRGTRIVIKYENERRDAAVRLGVGEPFPWLRPHELSHIDDRTPIHPPLKGANQEESP